MSDAPTIKTNQRGGFRAGAGRPKGAPNSRPRAKKHSDAIEASKIERILAEHYDGDKELSPTQLKAIEIRYARLKPTLSSVEQTVTDERDTVDPVELEAKLKALHDARPELFAFLNSPSKPLDVVGAQGESMAYEPSLHNGYSQTHNHASQILIWNRPGTPFVPDGRRGRPPKGP